MGSKSKSNTSSANYTTTETVNAALSDNAQYAAKGSAAARDLGTAVSLHGDANTITVTDNGAVAQALAAAEKASQRAAQTQGSVLSTTRDILNDQVGAVKQLAESLKLDDEKTAKIIALAVIVGVVLVAIMYFWKG